MTVSVFCDRQKFIEVLWTKNSPEFVQIRRRIECDPQVVPSGGTNYKNENRKKSKKILFWFLSGTKQEKKTKFTPNFVFFTLFCTWQNRNRKNSCFVICNLYSTGADLRSIHMVKRKTKYKILGPLRWRFFLTLMFYGNHFVTENVRSQKFARYYCSASTIEVNK